MPSHEIPIGSKVWINFPLCRHYGVYLGNNEIVHLSKKHRQVRVESVADFCNGCELRFSYPSKYHDSASLRAAVAQRAKAAYSILSYNCEAFANDLTGEKSHSRQVTWGAVAAVATVVVAAHKGLTFKQTALLALAGAICGVALANATIDDKSRPVLGQA